ncbi:GntR family transcriptional regulator [Ponticoccus alexandrii]|uniref:GntR family transcriptional regulator n=1 Tax=Ponticoccus alexandrii TaxID=1943633 RepID=A0ABX7FFQ6_9RHOB|nr:GntR family transcriptional regulator [Ponticoccus alexandrii]QRF69366.1 GntR family transcriptional regulator [Ponticoccus alexandrii]
MSTYTPLHHRLAQKIVEDAVLAGHLPGVHLVTSQLAAKFQISRTPIVRALDLLTEQGVLEKRSNRGYFVLNLDLFDREEMQSEDDRLYWRAVNDIYDEYLPDSFDETLLIKRYDQPRRKVARLLQRLSDEGVLRRRAGVGWKIETVLRTPEDVRTSLRYRMSIELGALAEPDYHAPYEEVIAAIREQKLILSEATHSTETFERNARFHERLVSWSNNSFFSEAAVQHNKLRRLWEYRHFKATKDIRTSTEEHIEILRELAVGNAAAARELLRQHLEKRMRPQDAYAPYHANVDNR